MPASRGPVSGARRAATAVALSFVVYLTPLVGPQAAGLLGAALIRELGHLIRDRGGRDVWWVAADVAAALSAQLAFGLLLAWFLGGPGWRRGLAVALPVFPAVVLLNYAYMVAIPMRFLIQPDTTPERAGWPLECAARDVWIPPLRSSPAVGGDAGPPRLWVLEVKAPYRYGLLSLPGCAVQLLDLEQSRNAYATDVAAGRALVALFATVAPGAGRPEWSVFDAATGTRTPLEVDPGGFPILSSDGRAVSWLRSADAAPPPIQLEAVVRGIDRPGARVVDLSALGRGELQLVQLQATAEELIVARGRREFFRVAVDGRVREVLPRPDGVDPSPETVRFVPGGWVAWDGDRERESYRVAWALPGRKGSHRVPRSRGITSLAVSPDGRWIALSVTSGVSLGSTQDTIYVLGTADGRETFRKYFPRNTRSSLAFLGPDRFAYTDLAGVHVLRIE